MGYKLVYQVLVIVVFHKTLDRRRFLFLNFFKNWKLANLA